MKLTKMDMHSIKEMKKEGMSVKDISYVMEKSEKTIYNVINGEHTNQDRIADRMEAFIGGAVKDSGCYSTESFEDDNGETVVYQQSQGEYDNPTLEIVEFEEELELFLDKLENNAKK